MSGWHVVLIVLGVACVRPRIGDDIGTLTDFTTAVQVRGSSRRTSAP
jgi:hypothetical protein